LHIALDNCLLPRPGFDLTGSLDDPAELVRRVFPAPLVDDVGLYFPDRILSRVAALAYGQVEECLEQPEIVIDRGSGAAAAEQALVNGPDLLMAKSLEVDVADDLEDDVQAFLGRLPFLDALDVPGIIDILAAGGGEKAGREFRGLNDSIVDIPLAAEFALLEEARLVGILGAGRKADAALGFAETDRFVEIIDPMCSIPARTFSAAGHYLFLKSFRIASQ
jgi:hypothetical protein